MRPASVLFVKLGALGDALMARGVPALARELLPGARFTWVAGAQVAPLVRLFPGVDEVVEADDAALLTGSLPARLAAAARLAFALGAGRRDLVLTGHADPRYRLLTRLVPAGARRSFGPGFPRPGRFHGWEYQRLLHGQDGPSAPQKALPRLKAPLPPGLRGRLKGRGPAALLFPGGARNLLRDDGLRRWPLGHYAALAKLLLKRGWRVWLGGAASDAWVRGAFAGLACEDLIGQAGLPGSLALCAAADRVVTHDSGPLHLAQAAGAATVALFGPTDPGEKVDPLAPVRVAWGGQSLSCCPCYDGRGYPDCAGNLCLSRLKPAQVLPLVLEP